MPKSILILLLCGCLGLLSMACSTCASQHGERYCAIRSLIKKNLHLSPHLVMAVDRSTVEAVKKEVTEADIPVLVKLLGDEENVVGVGAESVLTTFGEKALPALTEVAKAPEINVRMNADRAISDINSKLRKQGQVIK